MEKKKELQKQQCLKFRYGNFHRYYGNRLHGLEKDPRLEVFKKEWFKGRNVLDVGCNAGYLTLVIAKDFEPSWVLGVDIDSHLVAVARNNIKHYCEGEPTIGRFPKSLVESDISEIEVRPFPNNVWFRLQDYVGTEESLEYTREEYDVILALSITKWIHLNWGDDGIKRFFRRAYKNLRHGGRFIVEYQDFKSYWKRVKHVDEHKANVKNIVLKPEMFEEYLLKEVKFAKCEKFTVAQAASKGFDRPLLVFTKGVK